MSRLPTTRRILEHIEQEYGELTPEAVLQEAENPTHPLHHRFEWDDSDAAYRYRIIQAQGIIRSVYVTWRSETDEEQVKRTRAFVAPRDQPRSVYKSTEEVGNDPITSELILRQMQREIEMLKRKYGHLQEFWNKLKEMDPPPKARTRRKTG